MNTSLGSSRHEPGAVLSPGILASTYDLEADGWDEVIGRLDFHRAYRRLFEAEDFESLPDRPLRILDAGIGTGAVTVALAAALRRTGREVECVTGIDVSAEMLRQAESRLAEYGIRLEAETADVERLPFEDGSFDIVVCAHVVEHLARPLRAMAQLERVAAPGGRVYLMMTRCGPVTVSIQRRWVVQCARSHKCEAVLRDFGLDEVTTLPYPGAVVANLLSFCCRATKAPLPVT